MSSSPKLWRICFLFAHTIPNINVMKYMSLLLYLMEKYESTLRSMNNVCFKFTGAVADICW